jgi:hypothetical protein
MDDKIKILKETVKKLKKRKNVRGIFLAGSYGRNEQHEYSDIDLYVIVKKPGRKKLSPPWESPLHTAFLTIGQLKKRFKNMDWIFSRPLVLNGKILYDPEGIIKKLRKEIKPYPEDIRQFELRANVIHAKYQLSRAKYAFLKKDFPSTIYFLRKCAEEILFFFYVLNKVYLESERKIFEDRKKIKNRPKDFEKRLIKGACLDFKKEEIKKRMSILESLVKEVENFCKKEEKNWKPEYVKVLKDFES